jgi:hypothetical protein
MPVWELHTSSIERHDGFWGRTLHDWNFQKIVTVLCWIGTNWKLELGVKWKLNRKKLEGKSPSGDMAIERWKQIMIVGMTNNERHCGEWISCTNQLLAHGAGAWWMPLRSSIWTLESTRVSWSETGCKEVPPYWGTMKLWNTDILAHG